MLNLNFLPIKEQEVIKKTITWLMLRNILSWTLVVVIIIVIAMSFSQRVLSDSLNEAQSQLNLVTHENLDFANKIRSLNKDLDSVFKVQQDHVTYSSFFVDFSSLIPTDIQINQFFVNSFDNTFILKGLSKTREDLLVLEAGLESSGLFLEIKSPLSNLLDPSDIDFEFSGTIDLQKYKILSND